MFVRLRHLLIRKDPLHDVILVFVLDEASFDSHSLFCVNFPNRVGNFFHPDALLAFFQVTSNFYITIDRGELTNVLLGDVRRYSKGLVKLTIERLTVEHLNEFANDFLVLKGASVHARYPLNFEE